MFELYWAVMLTLANNLNVRHSGVCTSKTFHFHILINWQFSLITNLSKHRTLTTPIIIIIVFISIKSLSMFFQSCSNIWNLTRHNHANTILLLDFYTVWDCVIHGTHMKSLRYIIEHYLCMYTDTWWPFFHTEHDKMSERANAFYLFYYYAHKCSPMLFHYPLSLSLSLSLSPSLLRLIAWWLWWCVHWQAFGPRFSYITVTNIHVILHCDR